jgi:hypothetical protein
MRISEILYCNKETTKGNPADPQLDLRPAPFSNVLKKLARACTQNGLVNHFRNLNWKRTFLSKTRYMCGRQCSTLADRL